ncbi:MAG: LPS-assembly protein LptD, partial [Gammaproteobacteria bacterium]|nr:LPS-assembly protein LptD [Gammaproteobacteria bacterium]
MWGLRTLLAGALVLTGVMAYAAEDEDRSRVLINRYSGWSCTPDEAGDGWRCEGVRVDDDAAAALPEAAITDEVEDEAVVPSESASVSEPAAGPEPSAIVAAPSIPEVPETVVARRVKLTQSAPLVVIRPGQLAASYWIDRDALTTEERRDLPAYCDGVYRLPTLPYAERPDNDELPVQVEADEAQYALDGEVVLEGNVIITQGTRSLHTARATVHQDTRNAELSGGVFILEPDLAMQGTDADVSLENQAAQLNDAEFLLIDGAMRGTAMSIAQDDVGNLVMGKNGFTRCQPGNNTWRISASQLRIPKGAVFGTARNAVLRVKGVPIFYTPYIKFPVTDDRQSGFLFPNVGYSAEDGLDLTVPYYLDLAPNYDATVIPRLLSKRGAGAEVELRHLSGWQETVLSGAMLPSDNLFNGTLNKDDWRDQIAIGGPVAPTFDPADRWLYGIDHRGSFGRFRTIVDYAAVSDRDYFRDLGTDLAVSSRINLERRGEIRYRLGGLAMRLWAQRFQRLDEIQREEYQRLPEFEAAYQGSNLGPFEYSLRTSLASFDRDTDGLTGLNAITGERLHVEPRVVLPFSWPYGFLSFSAAYRYTEYDLESGDGSLVDDSPNRGIGMGSLSGGLFFERNLNWFDTPLVQTLEPRIYYLYQSFERQDQLPLFDGKELTFGYRQLFRENRFTGLDRIGDAKQLSVGLTTRFVNQNTGREYFRASLGEIVYFEDREVTLNGVRDADDFHDTSAIAVELASHLAERWKIAGNIVWDPNRNQVDEGAISVQYRLDDRRIFHVGYRNRVEQDIEQTDLSLYWPLSRH